MAYYFVCQIDCQSRDFFLIVNISDTHLQEAFEKVLQELAYSSQASFQGTMASFQGTMASFQVSKASSLASHRPSQASCFLNNFEADVIDST